jgi:hypothetical protein
MDRISWPNQRTFAFSIIDDTDFSTVSNTKPVYDFLADHGIYTTKTVWPLARLGPPTTGGHTLEDTDYCNWILDLRRRGYEIALHGISDAASDRARIVEGLERYRHILGCDPNLHTNHLGQAEGVYWGPERLDAPFRWVYRAYRMTRKTIRYQGATPGSTHFWGDLCLQQIRYVRNLVFHDINTLKMDPLMPFHDDRRPFVRYWFSSSYGADPQAFIELISERNQDRLCQEGGACIVYTHFGLGFDPLPADFRRLIRRLARLPGWFAPATQILDHVGEQRGWLSAGDHPDELWRMQRRWLAQQLAYKCTPESPAPPSHGPG